MKSNTGSKVRLGIFVTLGLGLFVAGVFYIGQKQRLFTSTFALKFLCGNVSGLQAGNNVRFSGINIGTVRSVRIVTDSTVQVEIIVDKATKKFIKKDAQASIGSEGLMGDKVVNINPGNPNQPEINADDFILCEGGNSIDEIMGQIKVVATNTAQITGDLAGIMDNIHQGRGTVGKLLMDTVFANNLDQTVVNVKKGAGGFKENMDAVQHSFLLKGYFNKKKKEQERSQKKAEENSKK
ncbi:MAG: hypothetical protein JWO06_3228 [Bacteroidota bacterium]|nr:hypothetical protein [Bacteroidota bacterium]